MSTLFNTSFENEEASHFQDEVHLRPRTYNLQESNVDLQLTIVDTVGFGDQVNKEERLVLETYVKYMNGPMTLIMKCQDQIKVLHLFLFLCSYKPIVDYIDAQFENFLEEELKIKRSLYNYHDSRIHICLYFIAPTGHSLKSLDLVTMKKLDSKVLCSQSVCKYIYSRIILFMYIHIFPFQPGKHYSHHCKGRHYFQKRASKI